MRAHTGLTFLTACFEVVVDVAAGKRRHAAAPRPQLPDRADRAATASRGGGGSGCRGGAGCAAPAGSVVAGGPSRESQPATPRDPREPARIAPHRAALGALELVAVADPPAADGAHLPDSVPSPSRTSHVSVVALRLRPRGAHTPLDTPVFI